MTQYVVKVLLSALVIVAVSEIAKRSSLLAAALASLPLTSILAFVWMHVDGVEPVRIAGLADGIFWLVLPSLILFIVFPALLRGGWHFWPSLLLASAATVAGYAAMIWMLGRVGVRG